LSFILDFVGDAIGDLIGQAVFELVLKPLHWVAWATGVALCFVISLGRFQVEPFGGDEEWLPEEGRPILYTFGATTAGCAAWIILLAAIFRQYIL
jgi:hypothetical protein